MNRARWALPAGAAILAIGLAGCETEAMFQERLDAAQSLSPGAIGALLFGGAFLSEDLTCVSGGVLVSRGLISFWGAALACTLGVWVSDSLLYFWGVLGRFGLLDRAPLRWIVRSERVERGSLLFDRHGAKWIVLSRFVPGSRVPLYVAAGLLGYPYARFAAWMALAAVLWAPPMVWLAMKLGRALLAWLEAYERAAWAALPVAVLLGWGVMKGLEWLVSRRNRELAGAAEADESSLDTGE